MNEYTYEFLRLKERNQLGEIESQKVAIHEWIKAFNSGENQVAKCVECC